MRPGPRRPWAISKPRPSPSSMFSAGTLHVVKDQVPHGRAAHARNRKRESARSTVRPGVSIGTRIIDCCLCLGADGIALAHDDRHLATRRHRAGDPPLAPVDDIIVAVAADLGLDVGGVGRGDARLRHREARTDFACQAAASSQRSFCSRRAVSRQAISMLPTSGALQLKISGAASERPSVSHRCAYSKLVRPCPPGP